ncbi:hypothetical protein [Dactylosporangium sp. NPDC048998]|uniref:hypothetical protein n=1 Tax=Dactylosporangium sp. NPDC048998 TaxID=3363976 RepID=UPI00371D4D5C
MNRLRRPGLTQTRPATGMRPIKRETARQMLDQLHSHAAVQARWAATDRPSRVPSGVAHATINVVTSEGREPATVRMVFSSYYEEQGFDLNIEPEGTSYNFSGRA